MPTRTFAITADDKPVALDATGAGRIAISVANQSGKPVRGQARLIPLGATMLDWLKIAGEVERNFSANEAHQFLVEIRAPAGAAPGKYTFRLNMLSVQNPDEDFAEGPVVSFVISRTEPVNGGTKSHSWLLWLLVSLGIVVVGGAVIWLILRKPAPAPHAAFAISPSKGFAPLSVQFTNLSTGDLSSHMWSFGDGATATNRDTDHVYEHSGVYLVTLLAADQKQQFFATNEVTVLQHAQADFEASPDSGPAPLAVHFVNHSVGDNVQWNWDFGNGITSKDQNPPIQTYSTPNTYNVRLTVQGPDLADGSSNSSTKAVQIHVLAPSQANFAASPPSGESPLTVQFQDQSAGNPTSWAWVFGDGGTSSERNPKHVYNKPGTFSVTLRVSGPGGTATVPRNNLIIVSQPVRHVPQVVGKTLAAAKAAITQAGLVVGKVTERPMPFAIHIDQVIGQDPPAGQALPPGRPVNLTHW